MNYGYSYFYGDEDLVGLLLTFGIYALVGGGSGLVQYVLRSWGVYSVAKNRGLKHAWFAWVPVLDHYLLGCVSDQYQYVVKGKNKSRRKSLLILKIIYSIFVAAIMGVAAGIAFNGFMRFGNQRQILSQLLNLALMYLPLLGVGIAIVVLRYMALYDLYVSCDPKNSTMYLVLSILIRITEPFFIFFNRNRDEGMPPRREAKPEPDYAPQEEENWVYE